MNVQKFLTRMQQPSVVGLLFVILLSYFTYFQNYQVPRALFWDENYHISSAQKYLEGVHFMEPHPPLGKLLIAAGELLLQPNDATNQFIGTDYAKDPPAGFSFAGYRFFPALLGWMTAPLFFGVFLLITRNTLLSILLSFLYIFDNGIIVHSRSAMLESTIHFFVVSMILLFLLIPEQEDKPKRLRTFALLFGMAFGALVTTKLNGLVMLLLIPLLAWQLRGSMQNVVETLGLVTIGFLTVFCTVWYIHFAVATRVVPSLPDGGYYQASDEYKQMLNEQSTASPFNFPVMLRDSMNFVGHYQRGVPKLDLCKADENGSPWFLWPFGGRTISYRWETPNSYAYRYLYLVPNMSGWMLGLGGVVLAAAFVISSFLSPTKEPLRNKFLLIAFLGLYVGYMVAISRIDRVMYLYHYFPPLLFSYVLFALAIMEIRRLGIVKVTENVRMGMVFLLMFVLFLNFQFFRPLTYYEPLTKEQFHARSWLKIWEMRCVNCERESIFTERMC